MKKFSRSLILSTAVALSAAPCLTANAANIMFVMDASGSMKKDAGNGYSRMDNAKYALARMLTDTSDKNRYGLTVYGHRKAKTCGDIQVVAHVGSVGAGFVNEYVQQLTPKGETPIADSVRLAANGFEGYPGQDNQVVLVTDGIEECGGNVCLLAEELGKNHIDLKVNVVGITLNDRQKSGVRCLADQTGGKFYDAADGSSLEAAFAQVKQDIASEKPVVIQSEPIAAPTNQIVFEDHFDADTLTDGWTVQSPNPDQFVTDEGELLIIASGPASSPTKNTMTNVFIHPGALPKGDWEIEVALRAEIQHGQEAFYFGAMNDNDNWVAAGIRPHMAYGNVLLENFIIKNEKSKISRFDGKIDESGDTSSQEHTQRWRKSGLGQKYSQERFVLVLKKQGRAYSMSGTYGTDGAENFKTFSSESLKMLRAKKKLFLAFGLSKDGRDYQGEGNAMVDYVQVRSINK